jgi:hypothetical protein
VTDADESPADALPADTDQDAPDAKEGIRDRSVREVVERSRDVLRKTRELLESSRDLLDRVRHRDDDKDADDAPGEHDADEASDDHAGVDARPVEGEERAR